MKYYRWTDEEKEYLVNIVYGRSYKQITQMMNDRFNIDLSVSQVRSAINKRKLNTGRLGETGRFKPGHEPAHKGTRGVRKATRTSFQKGHIPFGRKEIGHEKVNGEGYLLVKIQDGCGNKNWKKKHFIVWEEAYGPIPDGYIVSFLDGNKLNCDISNLILLSRQQNVRMNKFGLYSKNPELTRTGSVIADLMNEIKNAEK